MIQRQIRFRPWQGPKHAWASPTGTTRRLWTSCTSNKTIKGNHVPLRAYPGVIAASLGAYPNSFGAEEDGRGPGAQKELWLEALKSGLGWELHALGMMAMSLQACGTMGLDFRRCDHHSNNAAFGDRRMRCWLAGLES